MIKKLGIAMAASLAVVLAAVAVADASTDRSNKVLRLVARQTHAAEIPGDKESFLGTRFVGADEVFRDAQRVGTTGRSCEVVATGANNSARFQCLITVALDRGTITLQALPTLTQQGLEDVQAAVTGGTGVYDRARGEASVTQVSETEMHYTIDLR